MRQYISIDLPQSIWSPSVAVHQFHISDLQDIDRSLRWINTMWPDSKTWEIRKERKVCSKNLPISRELYIYVMSGYINGTVLLRNYRHQKTNGIKLEDISDTACVWRCLVLQLHGNFAVNTSVYVQEFDSCFLLPFRYQTVEIPNQIQSEWVPSIGITVATNCSSTTDLSSKKW